MITTQVIQFTQRPRQWHTLAELLGLTAHGEKNDGWTEFDGDGMLAIHGVESSDPLAGTTELWMLVDSDAALEKLAADLTNADVSVQRGEMAGIGATLDVSVTSDASAHVVVGGAAREPRGPVTIMPLVFTPDVAPSAEIAHALGLAPRVSSDAGTWADLTAPGGGLLALHAEQAAENTDHTPVSLSFEYRGDLDTLAERLTAAGFDSSVMDQAYNRTLTVTTPDGDELWVNGAQTDLYGYSEDSGSPTP